MKKLIRIFVVESVVLYFVSRITTGMVFQDGTLGLFIAAFALTVASLLIKPIVNLLLLPLNLVTFGLFRFLSNAITLFLVALVVPQISIGEFVLKGLDSKLVVTPIVHLPAGPLSYIAFSLLISLITTIIYWLIA